MEVNAVKRAVTDCWKIFEHFQCKPAELTEEQLREYFQHLTNEKKVARATATIAQCGVKFFYEHTLQRD